MSPRTRPKRTRRGSAADRGVRAMAARYKSIETKYLEARERTLRALGRLDRRTFLKVSAASAGAAIAKGLIPPHSFQLVEVANAAPDRGWPPTGAQGRPPFTFA